MILLFGLTGCSLDVVFPGGPAAPPDSAGPGTGDSGETGEGETGGPSPERHAALPVAPSAAAPMWQGLQEAFLDADGAPCTTTVAAAMSESAFCFVAADGELRCAGRVGGMDYGSTFVGTGVASARQVHLSPTFDGEDRTSMCALGDGVLWCLGRENGSGQLGNGGTGPNEALEPWGTLTDVVGAATGTWDQMCVLDGQGHAWCAGSGHGTTPVSRGTGSALLVDESGIVFLDDASRWRASAGRSGCFVAAEGLACTAAVGVDLLPPQGEPGRVVDGGLRGADAACWLEDDGRAWCTDGASSARVFEAQAVLLLAVNGYTDAACAVYADGSVACVGSNTHGKLGTGDDAELLVETIVAPAGSVDTICR